MRVIFGLALLVMFIGFSFNDTYGQISQNSAFLLEGSGFAVTEEIIKISEIDLGLLSNTGSSSNISFTTEDGFITLDENNYLVTGLTGNFLRDGQFIRIRGDIEDSNGKTTSVSFFGRLIEESKDASIYGFTGRIAINNESFKVVYTTKLTSFAEKPVIQTTTDIKEKTVRILRGSSSVGLVSSYIESGELKQQAAQSQSDSLRARYFSEDRISIQPGDSITIINDDAVSHRVVSGSGLGTHSSVLSGKVVICEPRDTTAKSGQSYIQTNCDFTLDGRIDTSEILPGKSMSIKFTDAGFYRLLDPNYPWMRIDGYVFPSSSSITLGTTTNQQGN